MGWSDCGTDSQGRPIGYGHSGPCDEPDCQEEIDRGLSYACGGMHGEDNSCEGYFCSSHLSHSCFIELDRPHENQFCRRCIEGHKVDYMERIASFLKLLADNGNDEATSLLSITREWMDWEGCHE